MSEHWPGWLERDGSHWFPCRSNCLTAANHHVPQTIPTTVLPLFPHYFPLLPTIFHHFPTISPLLCYCFHSASGLSEPPSASLEAPPAPSREAGQLVVKIGGPAYRIGVGGGAASSMVAGDNQESSLGSIGWMPGQWAELFEWLVLDVH